MSSVVVHLQPEEPVAIQTVVAGVPRCREVREAAYSTKREMSRFRDSCSGHCGRGKCGILFYSLGGDLFLERPKKPSCEWDAVPEGISDLDEGRCENIDHRR